MHEAWSTTPVTTGGSSHRNEAKHPYWRLLGMLSDLLMVDSHGFTHILILVLRPRQEWRPGYGTYTVRYSKLLWRSHCPCLSPLIGQKSIVLASQSSPWKMRRDCMKHVLSLIFCMLPCWHECLLPVWLQARLLAHAFKCCLDCWEARFLANNHSDEAAEERQDQLEPSRRDLANFETTCIRRQRNPPTRNS